VQDSHTHGFDKGRWQSGNSHHPSSHLLQQLVLGIKGIRKPGALVWCLYTEKCGW
jgi:hypothetical protein